MGKRRTAFRHERAKKAALTRWGRDKGAADEREFQKQTGTQERESVVDRDSPQKEVPVRDSEQGTNSVHGAEGLLSENSDGASGTSDFETPRRRQLGESPCEIGFRGERAEDPVLVHKVTLDPAYVSLRNA